MKKNILFLTGFALTLTLLGGCKSNLPKDKPESSAPLAQETPASTEGSQSGQETGQNGGGLRTGLAVITSVASSKDAGGEDGLAQVDSTVLALTLDAEGRISDCVIDAVQTKMNFSAKGRFLTDKNAPVETKDELGDAYGMKKASGIGKEWNEQAQAFANYVKGKTIDEVKGIAVNEEGRPNGTDLSASVTIHIGGFQEAVEKAAKNAQALGAKKGDRLGLGIVTGIGSSGDASGDAEGIAQADSVYTVTTTDEAGRISSCVIDASQARITFSALGKITSDLSAYVQTKNELGEAYGMKKASGIGKEWNEQARAFASYVTGKTLEEVKKIAVTDEGAPADSDLISSVTIKIGDFVKTLEKAEAFGR